MKQSEPKTAVPITQSAEPIDSEKGGKPKAYIVVSAGLVTTSNGPEIPDRTGGPEREKARERGRERL